MPVIQEKFHDVLRGSDQDGNIYECKIHPDGLSQVYLKLKGKEKWRMIGEIDIKHRLIRMKRVKARHYFHSHRGYGFNWSLINEQLPYRIDKILLTEDDYGKMDYYLIPLKTIREIGRKLKHVATGYELQWFVELKDLVKFLVKDKQIISESLSHKH